MLEPITKQIRATIFCRVSIEKHGNVIETTYQAAQTIAPTRPNDDAGPSWMEQTCKRCGRPLTYRLYSVKGAGRRRTLWVSLGFIAVATFGVAMIFMSPRWDAPADETSDFIIGGFVALVIACIIALISCFNLLKREQGVPGGQLMGFGNSNHFLKFDHEVVKHQLPQESSSEK